MTVQVGGDSKGSNMIEEIRELASAVPFSPFTIYMADGREVDVESAKDVEFGYDRVTVRGRSGKKDILPALHISGLSA